MSECVGRRMDYLARAVEGCTFYAHSCSILETGSTALYLHGSTEGYNAWNETCVELAKVLIFLT